MKKLLLILGEKEMDRYKISFGTSFLHSIIVRVPAQWSKLWLQNNTTCAIISKKSWLKSVFVNAKIHILSLKNKYLHIYEDDFAVKILRDDCTLKCDFLLIFNLLDLDCFPCTFFEGPSMM